MAWIANDRAENAGGARLNKLRICGRLTSTSKTSTLTAATRNDTPYAPVTSLIWIIGSSACCVCARKYQGKPPARWARRNSKAHHAAGKETMSGTRPERSTQRTTSRVTAGKKAQKTDTNSQAKYIVGSPTRIHCSAGTNNTSPTNKDHKKTRGRVVRISERSGTSATHASQPQATG